jgi:hypothetical protein
MAPAPKDGSGGEAALGTTGRYNEETNSQAGLNSIGGHRSREP